MVCWRWRSATSPSTSSCWLRNARRQQTETAREEGRSEALVGSYGEKSIAVLPFVDMSADKDQEYFSDGISEELLNLLAKIPQLRVISRSSAFSLQGQGRRNRRRSRSD